MPHLQGMHFNSANELSMVVAGVVNGFYQYSGGQRIRKVVEKDGFTEERIYLGSYERYRKYVGGNIEVERDTVHVSDDTGRIAMLEVRNTAYNDDGNAQSLKRFIYSSHLQSSNLELDEGGDIISYEEYHPYGTTAYQAMSGAIQATAKRYRFTGKERDEETGLNYHGARYYAPWLCRWTAVDPLESKYAGTNGYNYGFNNPITYNDPTGMDPNWHPPMIAPQVLESGGGGVFGYGSSINPVQMDNVMASFSKIGASQTAVDNGLPRQLISNTDLAMAPPVSGLGSTFDNYMNGIKTGPDRATIGSPDNSEAFGAHLRNSPIMATLGYYLNGKAGAAHGDIVGDLGMAVIATPGTPMGFTEPNSVEPEPFVPEIEAPLSVPKRTMAQAEISTAQKNGSLTYNLTAEKIGYAQPNLGEGRIFQHFTNIQGINGITGVAPEILKDLKIGQILTISYLTFGNGRNDFLATEKGSIFVTDLPQSLSTGKLNQIGVFGDKQEFAISFSEETAFMNNAKPKGVNVARGIYTIPASTQMVGVFTVKKLR